MQRYFAVIDDPRHQGYVKHKLSDILRIVMCAVLCGMDQLCDVMAYAQNKADFFRTYFSIGQIPSKPTVSRMLSISCVPKDAVLSEHQGKIITPDAMHCQRDTCAMISTVSKKPSVKRHLDNM